MHVRRPYLSNGCECYPVIFRAIFVRLLMLLTDRNVGETGHFGQYILVTLSAFYYTQKPSVDSLRSMWCDCFHSGCWKMCKIRCLAAFGELWVLIKVIARLQVLNAPSTITRVAIFLILYVVPAVTIDFMPP